MKKIVSIGWLFVMGAVQAQEGLWLPHQFSQLAPSFEQQGIALDTTSFAEMSRGPLASVGQFNGCSAVFVSSQGLLLTDYRCAMGSQVATDTVTFRDGFLAMSAAAERPLAKGNAVRLTLAVHNVTQAILQEIEAQAQGSERLEQIKAVQQDMVAQCQAEEGYHCEIHSSFGGLEYYLTKQLELRDIRLVYAPAASTALFAIDSTKTSLWPFHGADFSIYRVYVGKDGSPAEYQVDNVPYTPKAFATLASASVHSGDTIVTAGYPRISSRNLTAGELRVQFERVLPMQQRFVQQLVQQLRQRLTELTGQAPSLKAQLARRLDMLEQRLRDLNQQLQRYSQSQALHNKQQLEQQFAAWLVQEPSRTARYLPSVKALQHYVSASEAAAEFDGLLQQLDVLDMLTSARSAVKRAQGLPVDSADTKAGADASSPPPPEHRAVEVELAVEWLRAYASLPASQHHAALDAFFQLGSGFDEAAIRAQLTGIYRDSVLFETSNAAALATLTTEQLATTSDPLLQLAMVLEQGVRQRQQQRQDDVARWQVAQPRYMAGMLAFRKATSTPMYPDANGSLRVSVGKVKGYSPADGIFAGPFATIHGIAQRHTGAAPYIMSDVQRLALSKQPAQALMEPSVGAVPVSFLSTADSPENYAGAATFNTQGQLIGMQVQGITQGTLANYGYDESIHRAIHLDSRFIVWQLEQVAAATSLVQELRTPHD